MFSLRSLLSSEKRVLAFSLIGYSLKPRQQQDACPIWGGGAPAGEEDRASREKPRRESEMDLSRGLTFQSYSSLSEEKEEDQRVQVPSALLKTYSGLITTEARRQCTVAMPISVNMRLERKTQAYPLADLETKARNCDSGGPRWLLPSSSSLPMKGSHIFAHTSSGISGRIPSDSC